MKPITCLFILACALLALPAAAAQSSKKSKSATKPEASAPEVKPAAPSGVTADDAKIETPSAAPKDEAKDEKKDSGGDAPGLGFSSDFPFKLMRADSIEIDPEGLTVLTSRVRIESDDFNISCDQVKMDNKTKMVYATGNPVTLEQGKKVEAKCRNLQYNLATKSATLENEAFISQDNGNGTKMVANADKIKIDNDGKPGSQPKVSLMMDPRSNKPPEIRQIGTAKPETGKTGNKQATKVNETNLNMLNVPPPKTPGVD